MLGNYNIISKNVFIFKPSGDIIYLIKAVGNMQHKTKRLWYLGAFAVLFAIEVVIALFVRDRFIRPYGGDILVTVLLCCFIRIFFPVKIKLLPLWVFLFSVFVEAMQYINIVHLLGLGNIAFFRVIVGTSFSFIDILCYGVGCLLFLLAEKLTAR